MKNIFVFPGSFAPPTYGHFDIVRRAAEIFPEITIICSTNHQKNCTGWFSQEECKDMWMHYDLPKNVTVKTFQESSRENKDFKKLVMIRGIRDEKDMEDEKNVMRLNQEMFGIDKFFYVLARKDCEDISSSKARVAAEEFDFMALSKCVSPPIITLLLEKVIDCKNLIMVVGKPGIGKSTFLKILCNLSPNNIHIDTDLFSKTIKSGLLKKLGKNADLITLAIEQNQEMLDLVVPLWFSLLSQTLRRVPKKSNIFLEIPCNLKHGKELHRHVGNKVLYVGCENQAENLSGIRSRDTAQHERFINEIPGLEQSLSIARENALELMAIDSGVPLAEMHELAKEFLKIINHPKEVKNEKKI